MDCSANQALLRGTLLSLPTFSHENHGKRFLRFSLEVPRLSGTVDTLPVICEDVLLRETDPTAGSMVTVTGEVHSHNLRADGKRHLLIFVFASSVCFENGQPINQIHVEGALCRDPVYRRTPLGREICDIMLAVPRAFGRADYLPCILWGRIAQEVANCRTRDVVRIDGRLQSRIYTKVTEEGAQERVAYEISALSADFPEDLY